MMTKKQKKERNEIIAHGIVFALLLVVNACLSLPLFAKVICFTALYLAAGHGVLMMAIRGIFHGQIFDEKFLMAIATVGALVIGEYPEAVFVLLFFRTGELFEKVAVGNNRKSIASLMEIRPDSARVLRDGEVTVLAAEEIEIGEELVVNPGERIALDGVVIKGESALDKSALTGESLPTDVGIGDKVIGGVINLNGVLHIRVTHRFEQSTASRILELVENSALHKAPVENFITRFARYYTPIVCISALLVAVVPPLFLGNWAAWLHKALVFLVVSCPCALVISVPLTFFSSIGAAARRGVLVKGAAHLEKLSTVQAVVFDKTGTLTHGNFKVSARYPVGIDEKELLELAALAEGHSDHPIALSLKSAYGGEIDTSRIECVKEQAGFGVRAEIDGKALLVGNRKLMESEGVTVAQVTDAGTVVYVAREGEYLGAIVVADTVKESSFTTIAALKKAGVRTVMLTGDRREIGEFVAALLGIDEVHTELLPDEKVAALLKLRERYGSVAFVGDGINDAPVLAAADVGIAMGGLGSDAAIEAADIVLMKDEPSQVGYAMRLSRKTKRIVWQNIVFALGVKFAVMLLALAGYENMWLAGFADVGVSVIAICNAVRVNFKKIAKK